MVRLVVRVVLHVIANALGLIVAAAVLDDMTLDGAGFITAVLVFTIVDVVAQPLVQKIALQHSSALLGSSALISGWVALVVTAWISDGLRISGALTWVLATVIVWAVALFAGWILPAIFLKRAVQQTRR